MSADRLAKAKWLPAQLIGFDSVSDRSNLPVADFVEDDLAAHGVATRRAPNASGDKAALFATIRPRVDGGVVLSGHTDVVPVDGQIWSSRPFTMREAAGRLYGPTIATEIEVDAPPLAAEPGSAAETLAPADAVKLDRRGLVRHGIQPFHAAGLPTTSCGPGRIRGGGPTRRVPGVPRQYRGRTFALSGAAALTGATPGRSWRS
jgi:hypothetical protein